MPVTPNNKPPNHESDNIKLAKQIIAGLDTDFDDMFALAEQLKDDRAFNFARRILERARRTKSEAQRQNNRLKVAQLLALVTYKDPDLPPDEKLDNALNILQEADDLQTTKDQETLGLVGAIHKRRWEIDGQKQHLERSLAYYLRGYEQGVRGDHGITGINAAFVLDLIADQEEEESRQANFRLPGTEDRWNQAKGIRAVVASTLEKMAEEDPSLTGKWRFPATVAEAYFGLAEFDQARKWLKKATDLPGTPEWERESTIRQLALLSRLLDRQPNTPRQERRSRAWYALFDALMEMHGDARVAEAACKSAFTGKIGLALSGGGFRAALYHIGVLARLAELDILRKIEALSCVSGGSIIGAHYYLEVRKLLSEKPDAEITKEDYIAIVKRIERDFLAGVQTNIRTRVLANLFTNLKMLFGSNYSRTLHVGELYEEKIYARIKDGGGNKPRWLNEMLIHPKGEHPGFHPKNDNWRRESKIPILILNATSLNTGHNWQFTATWMGEPPSSIDSEVDGNYRLRRMYYEEAPEGYRNIRLGHAVAASSCVPGIFEPLAMANLYEGLTVRLVDGGVYDNQGTSGLMDQGCNILLVSDASGQMNTENDPGAGIISVPLRTNSVLQARVRVAQYRELVAMRRSATLRGLMYIHLKKDLQVKPLDWIDCPDPQDSIEVDLPLTTYGINRVAQERMSAIRTDLDSFSDAEARALMISGYRMTEYEIASCLPAINQADSGGPTIEDDGSAHTINTRVEVADWQFMKFDESLTRTDLSAPYLKVLSVASYLAFKIWKLSNALRTLAIAMALVLAGLAGLYCWNHWEAPLITMDIGEMGKNSLRVTWGAAAVAVITMALLNRLPAILRKILRFVDYRKTAYEIAVGTGMSVIGWLAAGVHLILFDKLYLRWGSQKHILGSKNREIE